jgi:hypothetical protein
VATAQPCSSVEGGAKQSDAVSVYAVDLFPASPAVCCCWAVCQVIHVPQAWHKNVAGVDTVHANEKYNSRSMSGKLVCQLSSQG